jgi:PmbA protein
MFARIQEKINALGCSIWELSETTTRGWEFYFIRHELDQNRVTDVKSFNVTLYRPLEDGFLGSASGEISPSATDSDIEKSLSDIYFQASLVKNPVYQLNDKPLNPGEMKEVDIAEIARNFISAMTNVSETETEDINSYEIFVKENTVHFLNSNGVEYTIRYPSSMIEVIVNARNGDHEIELYRCFRSGTCDADKLALDIEKALRYAKDRLITEPTPKLQDMDVIFSTDDAVQIYKYFASKASADMIYSKLSDWTCGKDISENMTGDLITLKAVSSLKNSSYDFPVDEEGAAMKDCTLIKNGRIEKNWGHRRYCQYLGIQDSFVVQNFVVEGGRKSEEEIRSGDYLEVVEYSSFQVNTMGGDVAGEIRLGYLHQNGNVRIVSGGSVSGQMSDVIPTMEFSSETEQYNNAVIPRVTRLKNLKITGVI